MKSSAGFTLLELIVVFSVIAILSTVGIVSFSNYNRSQELSRAVSDLVTFLNSAKSDASSQIKTSGCEQVDGQNNPIYALDGYRVTVAPGAGNEQSSVTLEVKCSDSNKNECMTTACKGTKTVILSKNIKITSVTPDGVFFYPLFQGAVDGGKICISSYGNIAKSISVSDLGIVTTLDSADSDFSCP